MRYLMLLALVAAPLLADQQESEVWPGHELDKTAEELAKNLNEQNYQVERLGDFGNHYVLLIHRADDGPAELHQDWTDFYVVREGSGTLHVGGKIEGSHEIEPGEVRGDRLTGAKKTKLQAGDTVNIPPKTPHQVVLGDGETITYVIVKVRGE